jgi:transcriptional regulator with PAS, ATPase and Fis domain
MQMKLLRVLQEKEIRRVGSTEDIKIDVRVIAATNENLEQKIKDKLFREDLYYRLSVIPIQIPPLRKRLDDIPQLVAHFLQQFNKEKGRGIEVSTKVLDAFRKYDWPGNVRELENLVKRLATLCDNDRITVDDLPEHFHKIQTGGAPAEKSSPGYSLKEHMKNVEQNFIQTVIDEYDGNKDKAAEKLGVSIATLYRKLNETP